MSGPALSADSLSVSLTVNDVQRSIQFYRDALGCEVVDRHEIKGTVQYAELRAGGAQIGLGQDDFAKGRDRAKGIGMRLQISTTQDVTALAARVKAAGVTLDDGPKALPWGPMGFMLTDPDGYKITVSNPR